VTTRFLESPITAVFAARASVVAHAEVHEITARSALVLRKFHAQTVLH